MAGNPLAKFFATVGFKADTSELDATIKRVKQDLHNITGSIKASPAARKITATQKAAEKVKTESKLLEASKIKSLRLIEDNTAKNIGLDSKHRDEKRKLNLAEKNDQRKFAAWNAEIASMRKKVGLKEKSDNSTIKVIEKRTALADKEISKQDAMTSRLRQQGTLKQIAANAYERTARARTIEIEARTAKLGAEATKARIRNEGLLNSLNLQNARNEALRIRSAIQAKAAEMRGGSSVRMNSNGVMTGGVGGLTARGALGSLGALGFAKQAFKVGNFQSAQPAQYEFLAGSKEGAQNQIDYVNKLVDDLKLNLIETDTIYKQFLGATVSTIGIEKTQKTFKTLNTFAVMMGASGDNMKRGIKAVQQMLSKQKLSAEELKCRLAA